MTDLFGKKKIIIDNQSYFSLDRVAIKYIEGEGTAIESGDTLSFDSTVSFKNGIYLANGHIAGYNKHVDFLRLALGKGWEYQQKVGAPHKELKNNWPPMLVFKGSYLVFREGEGDCFYLDPNPDDPPASSLNNTRTRQRIIISTAFNFSESDLGTPMVGGTGNDSTLKEWATFIKTGCKSDTGENLHPLIRAESDGTIIDRQTVDWFYDHYHETPVPYTPRELLDKQPAGKAFFVDYKTYYNEIMAAGRSALYENYTSNNFRLHNSLPNIYAFIKLMDNNSLIDNNIFDASSLREYMQNFLLGGDTHTGTSADSSVTVNRASPSVYNTLLRRYPLETLITLYGIIGANLGEYGVSGVNITSGLPILKPLPGYTYPTKIIEKIITMKPEKIDITGLIRTYLKEWLNALQYKETNQQLGVDYMNTNVQFTTRQGALENIGYNLIFSPNILPILNKVNKFKDYFPMYNQITFTTNTSTALGDAMKKMFITRFIATQIAASQNFFAHTNFNHFPHGANGEDDAEQAVYKGLKYYQNYHNTGNIFCTDEDPQYIGNVAGCEAAGLDPATDALSLAANGENSWAEHPPGTNPTGVDSRTRLLLASLWKNRQFVEHKKETTFELVGTQGTQSFYAPDIVGTAVTSTTPPKEINKGTIDFPTTLEEWIKNKDFSSLNEQWNFQRPGTTTLIPHAARDIRNFITYVNKNEEDSINLSGDDNVMWKTLLGSSFYAKLVDTYHKSKRSYSDLLAGKPAYTEDLFYRIEKHVKHDNAPTNEPGANDWKIIQNVIIPNTSEIDIAEHIDTQVKYGKHVAYKYKIYICRVVFGCRYKYNWAPGLGPDVPLAPYTIYSSTSGISWADEPAGYHLSDQEYDNIDVTATGGHPKFYTGIFKTEHNFSEGRFSFKAAPMVIIEPSIKIIEDEMYDTGEIRILDKPPVSPDINIVPYRAVNNKIKILMSGASDRYRAEPIKILDSDDEEYSTIMSAQRSLDDKVEFGSDDPISNFQVFRIDKKPKAYRDFELHPTNPFIFGGSGTLEDIILPNTKYYYTFRAVDNHGHISNPTPVYEVELIDEKGAVKPLIRIISFEKVEKNLTVRECQKYIYIKPSTKQMFFSDQPNVDSIFSTDDNSKTKKKKYRMRVTSKGSGKKIDINFSFEKKIVTD